MKTSRILSYILLLAGLALIIISFLYFGKNAEPDARTLNIIITSIIFLLITSDILFPWINLEDKPQRTIGGLGIRWLSIGFYVILAIAAMLVMNVFKNFEIKTQILVHVILLIGLFGSLVQVFIVSDKTTEVYNEEQLHRNKLVQMKKSVKDIQLKLEKLSGVPQYVTTAMDGLQEDIRTISPANTTEANELEDKFLDELTAVDVLLFKTNIDYELLKLKVEACSRTLRDRKQVYSV
jgi:hypothetical protein